MVKLHTLILFLKREKPMTSFTYERHLDIENVILSSNSYLIKCRICRSVPSRLSFYVDDHLNDNYKPSFSFSL